MVTSPAITGAAPALVLTALISTAALVLSLYPGRLPLLADTFQPTSFYSSPGWSVPTESGWIGTFKFCWLRINMEHGIQ